ncbi:MAG TPA: hypothetical protein VFW10_16605 [Steroidobacteraceae bacterium]|nr:hypothetical protein [Steroidobacteraceae bacterium]
MPAKSFPRGIRPRKALTVMAVSTLALAAGWSAHLRAQAADDSHDSGIAQTFNARVRNNVMDAFKHGRRTFRFDTFGDEAFWGGKLQLHRAIEGEKFGGVGPGISPATALRLGLKVDVDALPGSVVAGLRAGQVNLNDPATTLLLLKLNAVVGVRGFFTGGQLTSLGLTCALCHSTVDNSLAFGVGHRLDGWANRDLNVGRIIGAAPDLSAVTTLLNVDRPTLETVLSSWGPGKFDAEIFLDGKAFNDHQVTDGVLTGTHVSGAVLIPDAYDLAGFNQHTWTGAWGTVTYWNAFVAVLEMHGKGRFHDPRFNDSSRFPIAAANGFADINKDLSPDDDQVTSKLPDLQFYQLALPAPKPVAGRDFDAAAAKRGDDLFSGKAQCNSCHVDPLWTEPGWNLHTPQEIGIDGFEANRAPDGQYKTMNLNGIFVREEGLFMQPANKGRYYHDGRFATLMDVVNHYNTLLHLGLTAQEKHDLIEYLKSLPET